MSPSILAKDDLHEWQTLEDNFSRRHLAVPPCCTIAGGASTPWACLTCASGVRAGFPEEQASLLPLQRVNKKQTLHPDETKGTKLQWVGNQR